MSVSVVLPYMFRSLTLTIFSGIFPVTMLLSALLSLSQLYYGDRIKMTLMKLYALCNKALLQTDRMYDPHISYLVHIMKKGMKNV
jgi:hypothetical protein